MTAPALLSLRLSLLLKTAAKQMQIPLKILPLKKNLLLSPQLATPTLMFRLWANRTAP